MNVGRPKCRCVFYSFLLFSEESDNDEEMPGPSKTNRKPRRNEVESENESVSEESEGKKSYM